MPIYQSPADFPDRVQPAVEDELQDGEKLLAAMPRSGGGFFAKYSKYYLLTPERFVEFTKAPFGGIKSVVFI